MYVIQGPADAGNEFSVFKRDLIPAGYLAIVSDGEYANGGRGPSTVDGRLYSTRDEAEARMAGLVEQQLHYGSR